MKQAKTAAKQIILF